MTDTVGSIPDVIVDFVFERGLFYIVLANIGGAPACDIAVVFDCTFKGLGGTKIVSGMPLFQITPFLAPGKGIRTFLDTSASYFSSNQPRKINATINFSDRAGKKYSNVCKHDLGIYLDVGWVEIPITKRQ